MDIFPNLISGHRNRCFLAHEIRTIYRQMSKKSLIITRATQGTRSVLKGNSWDWRSSHTFFFSEACSPISRSSVWPALIVSHRLNLPRNHSHPWSTFAENVIFQPESHHSVLYPRQVEFSDGRLLATALYGGDKTPSFPISGSADGGTSWSWVSNNSWSGAGYQSTIDCLRAHLISDLPTVFRSW